MKADATPAVIGWARVGPEVHLTMNLPEGWHLSLAGQEELRAICQGVALPWMGLRSFGVHRRGGWVFCHPGEVELLRRVLWDVAEEYREMGS